MGKRVLLLKDSALGKLFMPRGKSEAMLVRVAGPTLPEDVKTIGVGMLPKRRAFGIILESAAWSDLTLASSDTVNGIAVIPSADAAQAIHFTIVPEPAAKWPAAAIEGYDDEPAPILSVAAGHDAPAGQEGPAESP